MPKGGRRHHPYVSADLVSQPRLVARPQASAAVVRALQLVLLGIGLMLCVVAGVGWLYLLKDTGFLEGFAPVRGALPLQQLAGDSAQPLSRLLIVWLPCGVTAGFMLRAVGLPNRPLRAFGAALITYGLLVATGALSDAVAYSTRISSNISFQFNRPGTMVATLLMAVGALVAGSRRR